MSVTVFGGGSWGKSLAFSISLKCPVKIVSRQNLSSFLAGIKVGYGISQCNFEESLESKLFVNAIQTQALRGWFECHDFKKNIPMMLASKGIERSTGSFVSDIASQFLDKKNLCFLAGPSFAKEILLQLPCALVIHSYEQDIALQFSKIFPDFIKIYIKGDVVGGEIAGAYKNVIAIASGICDGLNLGNNARASLLSRGLVEMYRFGQYFGASMDTFLGPSGAGDLFLSSSSSLSRNYRVGYALASGESLQSALSRIGEVAEGVISADAIIKIAKQRDIYVPIAFEIYKILNQKSSISQSLRSLMC